jgi:hypothetical protein
MKAGRHVMVLVAVAVAAFFPLTASAQQPAVGR